MESRDEDLLAQVVATRDPTAYEELLRRYQSDVRNWLRHLTRDPSLADDLAQDTFIRAWERLHTLRGSSVKAWLMKVAYNIFLQSRRKQGREQRLADAIRRDDLATQSNVGQELDPGLADLPKMLSVLSDDERVAMILCYAHGMSHGQITDVTGMPLGTVKSHIRRGKVRIQESFGILEGAHE